MGRCAWSGRLCQTALLLIGIGTSAAAPPATMAQEVSVPIVGLGPVREAVYGGLAQQIGTLPTPSGGGFTYQFDPALGVFTRSTDSFGPIFSERAETTGRGKFTLTASYTRHTFDDLDGVGLANGDLKRPGFFLIQPGTGLVAGATVEVRETVEADVYAISALYGITDRLDVGVVIPFLRVSVKERKRASEKFTCVPGSQPGDPKKCAPSFLPPSDLPTVERDATGLGDVVFRGKYNVWEWPDVWSGRLGLGVSLDVKVPTGDKGDRARFVSEEARGLDLVSQIGDPPLGIGVVRVKPQLIVSGEWFGVGAHANVGAELGTTKGITNDLVYAVGLDYTIFRRITLVADLLGRHSFDVQRTRVTPTSTGGKAESDTVTASLGVKVNPIGTLLVFVNFLVPLNSTGMRDDVTPTVGLEWSF